MFLRVFRSLHQRLHTRICMLFDTFNAGERYGAVYEYKILLNAIWSIRRACVRLLHANRVTRVREDGPTTSLLDPSW